MDAIELTFAQFRGLIAALRPEHRLLDEQTGSLYIAGVAGIAFRRVRRVGTSDKPTDSPANPPADPSEP